MTRLHNDANHMRRKELDSNKPKKQLDRLYIRDRGICQICFEPCLREDASRDHIVEFKDCTSKEQARDDANMRLAHVRCNNHRSNKPDSYIALGIPEQRKMEPQPLTHTMAEQLKALGLFELPDVDATAEWWHHENI